MNLWSISVGFFSHSVPSTVCMDSMDREHGKSSGRRVTEDGNDGGSEIRTKSGPLITESLGFALGPGDMRVGQELFFFSILLHRIRTIICPTRQRVESDSPTCIRYVLRVHSVYLQCTHTLLTAALGKLLEHPASYNNF